jgi:uncharacterized protein (UPF0276 family)
LIREQYPLSLHGVGLSIGAEGPLDLQHLQRLQTLIERYQPQAFSEHLAWSSHGPVFLNDLLPLAYDTPTLDRVCAHIDQVQNTLKRPMLLENPATYLGFERSTIDEPAFITEVIRRSGCGLLLDVNNVYVSCINHQRDPLTYLDALPLHAVGEIHLAGFAEDADSLGDRLLIDDHGAPVDDAVWALYRQALERVGPVATLIERDNHLRRSTCCWPRHSRPKRCCGAQGVSHEHSSRLQRRPARHSPALPRWPVQCQRRRSCQPVFGVSQ